MESAVRTHTSPEDSAADGCTSRRQMQGILDTKCRLQTHHINNKKTECSRNSENNNHQRKSNNSEPSFIWNYLTPSFLNVTVPVLFLLEVVAVGYYGIFIAIPYLFNDSIFFHQSVASIMVVEILLNWFFIVFTESSFKSSSFPKEQLRFNSSPGEIPELLRNNGVADLIHDRHHRLGVYPYWTWSPCFKCKYWRPPRCYHCVLCGDCILKRDHHCFFARTCIGFGNQKYFIVFCTWTFFSQIYAMVLALFYYFSAIWHHVTLFDGIPFFSFLRYFVGFEYGYVGILVLMGWGLLAFTIMSFLQFMSAIELLSNGLTTFEMDNEIDVQDCRTLRQRLRAVFGNLWYVNFILPLKGKMFSSKDDPYFWKGFTAPKKKVMVRLCKMESASFD
ncbi:hypothetical protein FSP39_010573 [Pinctada imbricata]|uniref:Palmitoyltransferase n=1 Tax=Pinctada imbricata TaxID=66713 RepID=A0AA88YC45_PINIB|nr:hypothetical protein FSP39_010573 [Pinctada imbricata]